MRRAWRRRRKPVNFTCMTRKDFQQRAARFTDDAVNADDRRALRLVPVALHNVAKLRVRTALRLKQAEALAKRAEAAAGLELETRTEKLTVAQRKDGVTVHPDVVRLQDEATRWEVTDGYLRSCVEALNQRLSAAKAEVEYVRIEAQAALDPARAKETKE